MYRVPCKDCDASYFGETGRGFGVRLNEHRSAVRKKDTKNACFRHSSSLNHELDFDNAKLIFQSPDWYSRLVVESSCIVTLPNYNLMRSTLAIDKFSANIVLSSSKVNI